MLIGLIIFIVIISVYWVFVKILEKKEILEKYQMSLWGPLVMWRTQKGRDLIKKISKKEKFWKIYGNLAICVCLIAMIMFTILLLWSATIAIHVEPSQVKPEYIIGIPGLNPLIPIWYGILALAVAMVVHEFAHGILSMVAKVKVKSLGILLCVLPVGAFVEPDEDELNEVTKKKRMRMFAVGPTTNIILAIVCALIFSWGFMGSVDAKQEGLIVTGVLKNSYAHEQGIEPWMEIIKINENEIKSIHEYNHIKGIESTQTVNITVLYKGETKEIKNVISGVVIVSITEDGPADKENIKKNSIITSINEILINNEADFHDAMNNSVAGTVVPIGIYYNEHIEIFDVKLDDKYQAYEDSSPNLNKNEYKGVGFLGVGIDYLGLNVMSTNFVSRLAHPYKNADSPSDYVISTLGYISLPFTGLSPFPTAFKSLYTVNNFLSFLPTSSFWIIANIFYWLFWLNLMVGITNSLPAIPLDGGFIFKDGSDHVLKKLGIGKTKEKREKYVKVISRGAAFLILFLIIWQILGPQVGALLL